MKRFLVKALALAAVFVLSACAAAPKTAVEDNAAGIGMLAAAEYPNAPESFGEIRDIREECASSEAFSEKLDSFAAKTAARLLTGNENSCYSPLSLYYALAVASSGAKGETAEEMLRLLDEKSEKELKEDCSKLFRLLYRSAEGHELLLANSLWVSKGFEPKEDFLKTASEAFYASIYKADFDDVKKTSEEIGKWISENTKGLLGGDYEAQKGTVLAILNTVYYVDQWSSEFYKENNFEADFFNYDGSKAKAEFMHSSVFDTAYFGEDWVRASLPLQNSRMHFILPDEGTDINELVASPEKLLEMLFGGREEIREIHWSLPKLEVKALLSPMEALRELGMKSAFEPDRADFSGIADELLYISSINQNTKLKIDEKGVEAAAYTEILIDNAAFFMEDEPEILEMRLDRPFILAIEEEGEILFMGVYRKTE